MSSEEDKKNAEPFEIVDLSDLDYQDQSEMTVMVGGKETSWKWTFAGPGHPMGVAQTNRLAKEQLRKRKLQEQAAVNTKKWKAEEKTPDEQLEENVEYIMERLLGWNPVKMNGELFPFSRDNARMILTDPKKGSLLQQCIDFLMEDASFTKRSAKR